jgi:hypothetical protein
MVGKKSADITEYTRNGNKNLRYEASNFDSFGLNSTSALANPHSNKKASAEITGIGIEKVDEFIAAAWKSVPVAAAKNTANKKIFGL